MGRYREVLTGKSDATAIGIAGKNGDSSTSNTHVADTFLVNNELHDNAGQKPANRWESKVEWDFDLIDETYYKTDPRAEDMPEDSEQWNLMLALAWKVDREICPILHGFRCGGTRLKKEGGGWVLRPEIDPAGERAWKSIDEYKAVAAKWLKPREERVVWLLQHVNDEKRSEALKAGEEKWKARR